MSEEASWGMACDDCGWKIYRSELTAETTLDAKLLVHQTMGCISGNVPQWGFVPATSTPIAA